VSASRLVGVVLATIVAVLAGCGTATTKTRPGTGSRSSGDPAAIPAAVGAGGQLAVDLLHRLGQRGGNVVFSPYSIETALSMVHAGAAGSTATQIEHVLGTTSPAAVAAGLAAIDARLTVASAHRGGPRVHLANGLWVQSGLKLEQPFTATLTSVFGAPLELADFQAAPEAARLRINAWVADRTAHLITNLFPAGTITAQTALVLANAIYLAARWAYPFDPSQTAPGAFTTLAGAAVQVPFMTEMPVELGYAHRSAYQAVSLPYLDSSLSMLAVMPAPGTFARFQQRLGAGSVAQIARGLRRTRLQLYMPKLHLSFSDSLVPVLSALGMPIAFTDAADFSRITAQTPLKIQAVQHAADLRVDEKGTVAAAATGISIQPTSIAVPSGTVVRLDRPFLLFLRDDATGAILFVAQVTDPGSS
jgi:serpin B